MEYARLGAGCPVGRIPLAGYHTDYHRVGDLLSSELSRYAGGVRVSSRCPRINDFPLRNRGTMQNLEHQHTMSKKQRKEVGMAPAFPVSITNQTLPEGGVFSQHHPGMTYRQWLMGVLGAAIASNPAYSDVFSVDIANQASALADAIIDIDL